MTVREGMAVAIDGEVSLPLKRVSEIHVMLNRRGRLICR